MHRHRTTTRPPVNGGQRWSTVAVNGGGRRSTAADHRSTPVDHQSTGGSWSGLGRCLKKTRYAVSGKVDTAYWAGFLGLSSWIRRSRQKGYAVLGIRQTRFLVKSWRGYAVSLLLDTTYWSEISNLQHPSGNISLHHDEGDQEIDKPQSDIIPIRRSTRTRHALDRMCLYIDDEEYELEDLNEPANYKAALLDPKFDKWLDYMNV
ncbi:hypothetical protein Tco_1018998 [Tanacetum coccineum]|uniref:Uncharacterized protein n=1 Tax=Tanacetum coccineum TaxID=301880 RepID=A0ABQ5FX98_9ASTR